MERIKAYLLMSATAYAHAGSYAYAMLTHGEQQACFRLVFRFEPVFVYATAQRFPGRAKQPRRGRDVVVRALRRLAHDLPFHIVQTQASVQREMQPTVAVGCDRSGLWWCTRGLEP